MNTIKFQVDGIGKYSRLESESLDFKKKQKNLHEHFCSKANT